MVAWSVNRGPDTLAVSSDSRCLAIVGPTEYIVTIMEAQSLNEVHQNHKILSVQWTCAHDWDVYEHLDHMT